ncbi:hypothetical protein N665_0400s0015 [Sinapis alba]|nr:hypothetical protein N665_0400s0015 [Sinapis alba]
MVLVYSLTLSLSITVPLGFKDDPCDSAIDFKVKLPSCCISCFLRRALFSPPVLHFSSLHRRNLSLLLRCLSRLNVVWSVTVATFLPQQLMWLL